MSGAVEETYHAALRHDLVSFDDDARLVGVVRHPTSWFARVDENRPALGPPADLLEEAKSRTEQLQRRGLCEEEAHNAAWNEVDFEARYREHVRESDAARDALDDLVARVREGETVVLVCFEGEDKRCHRRVLADLLRERV